MIDQKFRLEVLRQKNCLLAATNIVKNSNKGKWMHSGYGMTFDGKGRWNFGNDSARNVAIECLR